MSVERDDATKIDVESDGWYSEAVDAGELVGEGGGHGGFDQVGGISGGSETGEDEVFDCDGGFLFAGEAGGSNGKGEVADTVVGSEGGSEDGEGEEEEKNWKHGLSIFVVGDKIGGG